MTHYAEASPISGACDALYPSNTLKAVARGLSAVCDCGIS